MSRLIDQLRASDYPDKSPRDLTLEYGQYLEANHRDDVFAANPDFAQEYTSLKDEIARARRPGYVDEFKGAFGSAVDELQASGFALGALAADGARRIGIPGAEPIRNNLLRLMKEQNDEAAQYQPSVGSYEKISGAHPIEDAARYATFGLGTVAPSMVQAALSGLAGAAIGGAAGTAVEPVGGTVVGAAGGALLGLAEKRLAQKAVSKLLEKGIKTVTVEEAAKALPREAVVAEAKRLAVEYGGQAALAASSVGQEIGSIYADNPDAPIAAVGYGIPAGLLDVLPEAYIASRFLGAGKRVAEEEVKKSVGYFRRFAEEAAKVVPMEGTTEAAQTLLEIAAAKSGRGESPTSFTDSDYRQMLNAGVIGAIGGVAMAPVSAVANPHAHLDPTGRIDETVVDRLPLGEAPAPAGGMQFGGEIPEQDLTNPASLGPDARTQFDFAARGDEQAFAPGEANPYQIGSEGAGAPGALPTNGGDYPSLRITAEGVNENLPTSVRKAVERVDEAIGTFNRGRELSAIEEAQAGAERARHLAGMTDALNENDALNKSPLAADRLRERLGRMADRGQEINGLPADTTGTPVVAPTVAEPVTDAPLANLIGTTVEYQGYRGTLVRDENGNFMVLPPTREGAKPFWIEVADTGKDPSTMASSVGVTPTEPATMTPKPAPAVAIPGAPETRAPSELSKVPLGDLFPSDLVPRQDINPQIFTQPGQVAAMDTRAPAVVAPAAPAVAPTPAAAPVAAVPAVQPAPASTPAAPIVAPVVTITPTGVVTTPTVQQVLGATNGVQPLPAGVIPNLRRLRIFEQPKVATAEDEHVFPAAQPATLESQSVSENPLVALDKAVGKLGKSESNVAAVIIDNATGQAYVRGAYRGANNVLYIDMASTRKGTAVGKGSTVSAEADFLRGSDGRPAQKLFSERTAAGQPRYTVYGVGELVKGGGPRNWNVGPAATLNAHPGIQDAAKRYWNEQAKARPTGSRAKMPTANTDIEAFPVEMAAWRRENAGSSAAAAMQARVDEYVAAQNKKYGSRIGAPELKAWAKEMGASIEEMAKIEQKQAVLLSADYTVPTASTIDLFRSTLRALAESRDVDVAAFQQGVMGAVDSAAQTTGVVITPDSGRKIVAFALGSVRGPVNADTILSLLHETAHVVTDGLAEPLRVAFQDAVERLPYSTAEGVKGSEAHWLMNPRSLDIRLLANADPAQLSPEQRAALERLTPQEIAAARRIDPAALVQEQMAEHLAQLGWDKSEAKGVVQRFIRFVKELWLRTAMAIQRTLKGDDQVSPDLARKFVENRFLQFVHRDSAVASDRINDLLNWLGVPPTERQWVPVFPAGADWDQRMQYVDVATGNLIPVDFSTYTPESQTAYLKTALDNAARFIRENPNATDTPKFRQTKRAAFSAPLSFTPSLQTNTVFAAVNLEEEIYRTIAAHPDIGPLLTPGSDFFGDWLRLPDKQLPYNRRAEAEAWAKANVDPTTGAPITFDTEMKVDALPAAAEPIVDREGNPVTVKLTEAQDKALQQTIASIGDTQSRVQRRITYEANRITDLERTRKKNPADFPVTALKELDELKESLPLRQKIAGQLTVEKNALIAKFQPGDLVNIYPTAEYLTVPSPDATEAQIRDARKGVVPRDLKFTDKAAFASHLGAMEAWLLNPDNQAKGQIYGTIAEQYRKLNQIPVDLEISNSAGIFRRAITGGFADEFRAGGLRALRWLGQKVYGVVDLVNQYDERARTAGLKWSGAFAEFARAVGSQPDQSFKERVWDPMMRVWNFIDVSERNQLGTPEEGNLFATIEGAMKHTTGVEIDTPAKRAALRNLLMHSIESERIFRQIFEQHPELKVKDDEMGIHRRLVSHGLVTGRRSVARHITGLFMRMNPVWSDTKPLGADDVRTFWDAASDVYRDNRADFDAKMGELFPGYVVNDFVEPLVNNNTQIFQVTDADGVTRKASLLRVRQAWNEADGNVTQFAQNLHALEGGKPGEEGRTVGSTLAAFRRMFEEIKSDQDSKNGTEALGHEILPRQMMDARIANDWPAEWVSYATYDSGANLSLLHQLARASAFGRDAISGSGELSSTIREAKKDLAELYAVFDDHYRNGKSEKEIAALMGADEAAVARNSSKIAANLDRVETAFRTMSSHTNYLAGDFRLLNDTLGLMASLMVGSPRGAGINLIGDLLGPLVSLKFSRPALAVAKSQITSTLGDAANSVLQAFGQNAVFNIDSAKRIIAAGGGDPENYVSWRDKIADMGPNLALAAPTGFESAGAKLRRKLSLAAHQGRTIIPNLGSPFQGTGELQTLSPKLRWNLFGTTAFMTLNANIRAAYTVFNDLGVRGVDYVNAMPVSDRAQFVRELELGVRDLDAQQLSYHGGVLLNDKAAFDSMRSALETKIPGESGVGKFVAKAYRRFEGANGATWSAVGDSQFTGLISYANSEWTLQSNFASLPPFMQSGPLRPLFIFLSWPYNAMRRFTKSFVDAEGRIGRGENGKVAWWGENSTIMDGMKAFFLLAAPATIAGSFAIDWYDKYLLGKKQNLRDASWLTAVPGLGAVADPAAFVERIGRYGSMGLAGDVINQIVNFDTQRNLSLDNRIVAVSALGSMVNALITTPIHTKGNLTWASTGRPLMQAMGGGGILQYLQISQNLLGLNNQDAAINARINTGNHLRAAGRELNLPVAVFAGPTSVPTPISPYLQQMELGALVGNNDLFREAYQNAVQAARDEKKDNPEKYVADNFAEHHPLKRLFKGAVSETDYRKMLGAMDEYGSNQVRAAVNSFNRFLTNWFGKKAYYGKVEKDGLSVEALLKSATKINADIDLNRSGSLLTIP